MKLIRILLIGIIIVGSGIGLVLIRNHFSTQMGDPLSVNLVGNTSVPDGFARADGSHIWNFPTDFGPHTDYQTEWWYYTGNLQTEDNRQFGYQLTFFRRGLVPSQNIETRFSNWGADQVFMGHFAITDIQGREHLAFEKFSRGAAGLAGAKAEPFHVWLENWEIVEKNEGEWRLKAEQDGVGLELYLRDEKGVIFQGIDGYSQKGPELGNASYYYSQPRLQSNGNFKIRDEIFQVTGLSWMDHEFSTSALSPGQVGWDWFSLQLDDSTDLMLLQIRRSDGSIDVFSSGTVINPDGTFIHLEGDEFKIKITDSWKSPDSGGNYPASWILEIPQIDLMLEIEPYLADQELRVSYTYWEGAVGFRGKYGGKDVMGSGYVELIGYVNSMEDEF